MSSFAAGPRPYHNRGLPTGRGFSEGEGWITVGRTPGYGEEGNADVFRVLIEDGEVVREVNLTKSGEWESNPNWGSH